MAHRLKQFIPPIIIDVYKSIKNGPVNKLDRLHNLPRFTEGEIQLFEKDFYFPDAASVVSTYKSIFENGVYNFNTESKLPFIIDLGANIGLSIMYFKQLYPDAKIVALEADPHIYSYLEKNAVSFNWKNVTLVNKAAYDRDTTLHFFSEGADGGRINSGLKGTVEIEAIDIRKIFPEDGVVDMLKIDIEGAEVAVLERCADNLKSVRNIFIEYHSDQSVAPQKLSTILSILEANGFRYDIQHIYTKKSPFLRSEDPGNGFDLQLEIFAWKTV